MVGLVVAIIGAIIAVASWFGFQNIPFTVLGALFFIIGIIALSKGDK